MKLDYMKHFKLTEHCCAPVVDLIYKSYFLK